MALVPTSPASLSGLTLDQLACLANQEHQEVGSAAGVIEQAISDGLMHAIRAGEALLAARSRIEPGQWVAWLSDHIDFPEGTARPYIRLAEYRDNLLAAGRPLTINTARAYLRGLPAVAANPAAKPDEVREEALRLHRSGASAHDIAGLLGVSWATAREWVDPQYRVSRRRKKQQDKVRRRDAQRALARQEQDRGVRKAGGSVADAYGLLRRCEAALDKALIEAEGESRDLLRGAMASAVDAEDRIVRALKATRRLA